MRVNRRLAPSVYLGVLPVREGPDGHTFLGDGAIVDYAVRMRRLPEDRSARSLLRAGGLDCDHLEAVADLMADFYRKASERFAGQLTCLLYTRRYTCAVSPQSKRARIIWSKTRQYAPLRCRWSGASFVPPQAYAGGGP